MKFILNKIVFILSMFLAYSSFAFTFTQQEYLDSNAFYILKFEQTEQKAQVMTAQFVELLKKQKPNVPVNVWKEIQSQINTKRFVEKLIPVYEKYYTEQEINKLIAFYKNPSGSPPIKPSKEMEKEIYNVSNEYGKEVGAFIQSELKKRGY